MAEPPKEPEAPNPYRVIKTTRVTRPARTVEVRVPEAFPPKAGAWALPLPVRLCVQFLSGLLAFTVLAVVTLAFGLVIHELEVFHVTQYIVVIFRLVEYAALGTEVVCFLAFLVAEAKTFIVALFSERPGAHQ